MDTKELVERLRVKARHEAGQIEFVSSRQFDHNIFAESADTIERLERERDRYLNRLAALETSFYKDDQRRLDAAQEEASRDRAWRFDGAREVDAQTTADTRPAARAALADAPGRR